MSKFFRASFLLTFLFGFNKVVALLRQYLVAQEFGLSPQMDAFNIANNVPDLLFSLISGSALALAFIPTLTEYLDKRGEKKAWLLFSQVANLVFITTASLAGIAFLVAPTLVSTVIAPGFSKEMQELTVTLMRLNLCATIVFSVSGMMTAALQAHKHFLFPAIAPILHNVGLLLGLFLFVKQEISIGPLTFMGLGAGIYGLEFGVILGAILHLSIQMPIAYQFKFRWSPIFSLRDKGVKKVLSLMVPRILTVFLIQIIFFSRDNFASRMEAGAISALTYGFFLLQVPETLIGTAIGTALLPTLSNYAAEEKYIQFQNILQTTIRVIFASCIVITTIAFFSLDTFLGLVFNLPVEKLSMLNSTTKMFFLGLTAHSLLEVTTRAFYATQDTRTPFLLTIIRVIIFVIVGVVLSQLFGVSGLALADAIAVSSIVIVMLLLLNKSFPGLLRLRATVLRTGLAVITLILIFQVCSYLFPTSNIFSVILANSLSFVSTVFILKPEWLLLKKA